MDLILRRTAYGTDAATGRCLIGTKQLFTIEQPWRNNQKGASCVPEGKYDLIPYLSPKHGQTWYLKNDSLGIGGSEAARNYCELHSANWAEQLEGCIAFGLEGQPMYDPLTGRVEAAIENSKDAVAYVLSYLGPMSSGHTITIVKGDTNGGSAAP